MRKLILILALGVCVLSSCSQTRDKENNNHEDKRTRYFSPLDLLK